MRPKLSGSALLAPSAVCTLHHDARRQWRAELQYALQGVASEPLDRAAPTTPHVRAQKQGLSDLESLPRRRLPQPLGRLLAIVLRLVLAHCELCPRPRRHVQPQALQPWHGGSSLQHLLHMCVSRLQQHRASVAPRPAPRDRPVVDGCARVWLGGAHRTLAQRQELRTGRLADYARRLVGSPPG